jgi:endonuclease/exonuclease/phosphatase family metal-dependent hydrolase
MRTLLLSVAAFVLSCGEPIDPAQREWLPDQDTPPGKVTAAAETIDTTFSVVFYNVENLFDTKDDPGFGDDDFTPNGKMRWAQVRYNKKLYQLAQAIAMAGEELPVMIGLCEVENRKVVEDLARTAPLKSRNYAVIHQDSPDERGIDVALLVDKDRASVGESVWLTVDLGSDRTRDILHATVDMKGVGPVEVFVNHWPSRREGEQESAPKRMAAAKTVREEVDRLLAINDKARIIIMGDLNDEPLDASLKKGLLTDELISDDQGADLYDLVGMDKQAPVGSISYNGKWQYFDHLIVSRSLAFAGSTGPKAVNAASVKDGRLIFHHPKYGDQPNRTFSGKGDYHPEGYSDHLPVVLRLE